MKKFINFIRTTDTSKWTIIFIGVFFIIFSEIKFSERKNSQEVVRSDAKFYHEYISVYLFGMQPYPRDNSPVSKVSMGMAVTYLPAIGLGYVISEITQSVHNNAKGKHYQWALYYLGIGYTLLGFVFVRKLLKPFINTWSISVTLMVLFFATNLFYYCRIEPIMVHPTCFFVTTAFFYFIKKFIDSPHIKSAIISGLTLGLLILIRPVSIIVTILPIVYLFSKTGFHGTIEFLIRNWLSLSVMTLSMILIFSPQMFYWHYYTGKLMYYSYGNEKFFWSKPATLQFLISIRKGWFIYTPVMLLIIPGAIICYKKNKLMFWTIFLYTCINIYILSSWWCWWYGGSFGMRPMIDSYGLLSFWIGYFIQFTLSKSKGIAIFSFIFISFCTYLNLFQTRQLRTSRLHWDSMSWPLYKKVFLNNHVKISDQEYESLINPPDYDKARNGERFW